MICLVLLAYSKVKNLFLLILTLLSDSFNLFLCPIVSFCKILPSRKIRGKPSLS